MGRTIARIATLTVLAAVALAAVLYGIVLNGFGLFPPSTNTTSLSHDAPPREIVTRVDPGVSGARGPVEKSDRADLLKSPEPPAEPLAEPPTDTATDVAIVAPPPQEQPPATPRAARDVTPPNVLRRATTPYREPDTEEKAAEEEVEEAPTRRYHRVLVKDAGTLESGDVTIRFAGIEPIPGDKTCSDESGRDWPCGRVAAAELSRLIRHRAVDCAVVSKSDDGITWTCTAGLQDLNAWLVEQGWAEAPAGGGYAEEAETARTDKRGIYRAEWNPGEPGGSDTASLTAFTAPSVQSDPFANPASAVIPDGSVPGGPVPVAPVESPADQGAGLVDAVQGNE